MNRRKNRLYAWSTLSYAYVSKHHYGQTFILLSAEVLGTDKIKDIIHKAAILGKICGDHYLIVYIGYYQDLTGLKSLLANKFPEISDKI